MVPACFALPKRCLYGLKPRTFARILSLSRAWPRRMEEEEEERLYLHLEPRERVQTNEEEAERVAVA